MVHYLSVGEAKLLDVYIIHIPNKEEFDGHIRMYRVLNKVTEEHFSKYL